MKYVDTKVVFREVPDEITLAINISNCPVKCPGCHSSYLAKDVGDPFNEEVLESLIAHNPGITCVSFMGGDADPMYIRTLALYVKEKHPLLKTSWYSGRDIENARPVLDALNYVKVGPYIDECGPLNSKTTNQRFYFVTNRDGEISLEDKTYLFQ